MKPEIQRHRDADCETVLIALEEFMHFSNYAEEACEVWSIICWLRNKPSLKTISHLPLHRIQIICSALEDQSHTRVLRKVEGIKEQCTIYHHCDSNIL